MEKGVDILLPAFDRQEGKGNETRDRGAKERLRPLRNLPARAEGPLP